MSDVKQSQDPRVQAALADYLDRIDRGERVDREAFLAQHAEIADALQSFLATSEELQRMVGRRTRTEAPAPESHPAESRPVAEQSTHSVMQPDQQTVAPQNLPPATQSGGLLPERFGRYRVIKPLGGGAMGMVYLAEDTQLDRQVALKIPNFDLDETGELLERFHREAKAAAKLRHTNICPVYDSGAIDGRHFISMAYIPGKSLASFIRPDKLQSERQCLAVVRKIALGLQNAHDMGVVHRDLKPANVMVDEKSEPVITDFGLASLAQRGDQSRLTQSGMILGSPAYMSPEQIEGDPDRITPAADQYALGVILYELLTGQLPFRGNITQIIHAIVSKQPAPPSELRPGLDPRVEALCLKMMAKAPAERFASVQKVAEEIGALLKELPSKPGASGGRAGSAAGAGTESAARAFADAAGPGASLGPDAVAESVRRAQQCLERFDYEQAVRMLEQIPEAQRTREIGALLAKARGLAREVGFLLEEIDRAVAADDRALALGKVDELDRVAPGHPRSTAIRNGSARLPWQIGDSGPTATRGTMRTREKPTRGKPTSGKPTKPMIAAGVAGLLLLLGVVLFFRSGKAVVRVEINDPNLEVTLHGNAIKIAGETQEVNIRPGDGTLKVRVGDVDFTTDSFTLKKGENPAVVVTLVDDVLLAAIGDKPLGEWRIGGDDPNRKVAPDADAPQTAASADAGSAADANEPRATDLSRQVWQFASGYFLRGPGKDFLLKWDFGKKDPGLLRELSSTPESIDLRFYNVPSTFRLEKDKALIKDDRIRMTEFARTFEGQWSTRPESADPKRQMWVQPHGYFLQGLGKDWFEKWANGQKPVNLFREVSRTEEYVELRHAGVPVTFRLYADKATILDQRKKGARFTQAYVGEWKPSPGTPSDANRAGAPVGPSGRRPPADAVVFEGHSYKHFPMQVSWTEAKRYCESLGGHLPIVRSVEQNNFLTDLGHKGFTTKTEAEAIWLGATDAEKEGDWRWVDGSPVNYRNWATTQPNNRSMRGEPEHYAVLLLKSKGPKDGIWNDQPDVSAEHVVHIICEWDELPAAAQAVPVPGGARIAEMEFARIPAGEFVMGSEAAEAQADEKPAHLVRLTRAFEMGRYEVTVGQFRQFVEATQYRTDAETGARTVWVSDPATGPNKDRKQPGTNWQKPGFPQEASHPVVCVTNRDAQAFCDWLTKETGRKHRLPTEAEWEYACRAGTKTDFPVDVAEITKHANVADASLGKTFTAKYPNMELFAEDDGYAYTAPVGVYRANAFGLCDMLGNVWERCADSYDSGGYGQGGLTIDPLKTGGGSPVIRGGSFFVPLRGFRSSNRSLGENDNAFNSVGFRVVREIPESLAPATILTSDDWEWTEPENLGPGVNTSERETSLSLTSDEKILVFSRDGNIYLSRRDSTDAPFPEAQRLPAPISLPNARDGGSSISGDGLILMFASDRGPKRDNLDIFMAERKSIDEPFGTPVLVRAPVSSPTSDHSPWLSPDGLTLIVSSDRKGGQGLTDLQQFTRASRTEPWGGERNLGAVVNTPLHDVHGAMSSDGLVLFRSTLLQRPGRVVAVDDEADASANCVMCVRTNRDEEFRTVRGFGEPFGGFKPFAPVVSADGRRLYFTSRRPGGQGSVDLYLSRRVPKAKPQAADAPPASEILISADWEWTEPESMGDGVNTSERELSPSLTADEKILFFTRAGRIHTSRRNSIEEQFPPAIPLPNTGGGNRDLHVSVSGDGLLLVHSSTDGKRSEEDIFQRVRKSLDEPFGEPVELPAPVNSPLSDRVPHLSSDGLSLVLSSSRPGGEGMGDLYRFTRTSRSEPFGNAENLGPVVNTPKIDAGGWMSPDRLVLFRTTNLRVGDDEGSTVVICTRRSASEPFQATQPFGGKFDKHPPRNAVASLDGRRLYFASQGPGGKGEFDLWMSKRVSKTKPAVAKGNAPASEGWIELFNGRDLDGWKQLGGQNDWKVESGALKCSGGKSRLLYTQRAFGDIHLQAECRLSGRANSGVVMRCSEVEDPLDGCEAQLAQPGAPGTGKEGQFTTGSIWGLAPYSQKIVEDNAWFTIDFIASGKTLTVKVNGRQTATADAPERLLANGYVGLTQFVQGETVEFRKVRMRDPDRVAAAPAAAPVPDYQAIAAGKWVQALHKQGAHRNAVVRDGAIEISDGHAYDESNPAADLILRAKVQRLSRQTVMLTFRDVLGVYYSAFYQNDGFESFGFGMRSVRFQYGVKQQFRLPSGVKEGDFFEFACSAVGDTLTVYADGKKIGSIRDADIKRPGGVAVHTTQGKGVFRDVELMVLDKVGGPSPGPVDPDAPAEFTTTESKLKYRIRRKSEGEPPKASNSVKVHYKGWLDDGTEFDNSYVRATPTRFSLTGVIPAWKEGLQLVAPGGMIEFDVPPELAYGSKGAPPRIPPNARLHFLIELIEIE